MEIKNSITIRISNEDKAAISDIALIHKVSVSSLLRLAIQKIIKGEINLYE